MGEFAKVDDEDFDRLSKFKWRLRIISGAVSWRAARIENGKYIFLHREVRPDLKQVEFADGDGTNCQKANLIKPLRDGNRLNRETHPHWNERND